MAYLNHARGKVQLVTVIVLSDVVFFLQESNQKFHFVTQDNKVGSDLAADAPHDDTSGPHYVVFDLLACHRPFRWAEKAHFPSAVHRALVIAAGIGRNVCWFIGECQVVFPVLPQVYS